MKEDIRWIQRFSNYKNAFEQLSEAVELSQKRNLSKLEKQGLIKSFEFTIELSWKVLKDFLEYKGNRDIYGSRDAIREAFKLGVLENGEVWLEMIKSRNLTSHIYDESIVDDIIRYVKENYYKEFEKLKKRFEKFEEESNE